MRVNFFKEVLVVNNRESPSNEVFTTREMDYYYIYQEYYCRFPIKSQELLIEDEIVDVAKCLFASQNA